MNVFLKAVQGLSELTIDFLEHELIKHEPEIQEALLDEAKKMINVMIAKFNERLEALDHQKEQHQ